MAKVIYTDKADRRTDTSIPMINKVVAADMNEIKASINALYDLIGTARNVVQTVITSADFAGPHYINTLLIGLTAMRDFNVFTNGGSGVVLNVNDGYTFTSGTGTINMEPGDYLIQILVPLA